MIVLTLAIFVLLAFICTVFIRNKVISTILSVLFFILVAGNIALIVLNDHEHYGMEEVTKTKTTQLYPAVSNKEMNMLLYQPVGTKGKENIYIYRTSDTAKKPKHTKADSKVTSKVEKTVGTPKLVKTLKYYTYKSDAMKMWFGIADNDNHLISTKNTFYVKNDWLVLSTSQAKALQKQASDPKYQAQMKAQAQEFAKKAVAEAMKKNKKMNAQQKNQVIQNAVKQFQVMKKAELIKSVMSK